MPTVPRFGFLFDFSVPLSVGSPASWWPRLIELAAEIDQLGYDTIWLAEHHFTTDSFSTSPLLMLGPIATVTARVRLGTYVLLMPLHHPLRVAEESAAIDTFSQGRLEVGLGIGYRQQELDGFGVPRQARKGLLEEGVEILRKAWSSGPFDFRGQHFHFDGLDVTPKPFQPEIPLWLSARNEIPARRAGRLGTHIHLLGGNSIRTAYEEEFVAHGHDPAQRRVSIFKPFFVTEDPTADLDRYRAHFEYFTSRHASWVGANRDVPYDEQIQVRWGDTSEPLSGMRYLFGTPEQCLAELRSLYLRKPFTDLIAPITPPYDIAAVTRSMRLFATEVMEPFTREVRDSLTRSTSRLAQAES